MEELRSKTCKELRDIAKERGIVGRWDMNKQQLIDAISRFESFSDDDIEFETDCIIKSNDKLNPEGSQKVTMTTHDYIYNMNPGTLVAFKLDVNKDTAMSGKFVKFDESGNLIIETKRGTLFTLDIKSIVWVKTGKRWPRWVYSMFNICKKQEDISNDAIS